MDQECNVDNIPDSIEQEKRRSEAMQMLTHLATKCQVVLIGAIRLTLDCYFMFSEVYQKYYVLILTLKKILYKTLRVSDEPTICNVKLLTFRFDGYR